MKLCIFFKVFLSLGLINCTLDKLKKHIKTTYKYFDIALNHPV